MGSYIASIRFCELVHHLALSPQLRLLHNRVSAARLSQPTFASLSLQRLP